MTGPRLFLVDPDAIWSGPDENGYVRIDGEGRIVEKTDGPFYLIDKEKLVRRLFLQAEGIDPEMAYNDGKPYGDYEWAIDRDLAWKAHGDEAEAMLIKVSE